MAEPEKKRARHLMDPANPQREVISRSDDSPMHLEPVQKWVLSILAFTTIIHLAGGLALASLHVGEDRLDARIGLNLIGAAFGVIAVAVFRAIHQKPLLSPWLLVGVVPGVVGMVLALR